MKKTVSAFLDRQAALVPGALVLCAVSGGRDSMVLLYLLRELAEEKQVFYVDTENAAAAGDGSLPADAAADGIHLVKDYCEKWLDYLKTHTAPKK